MTYRIWATVYGTIGYREAWLKENGKIFNTENRDEAEEKAKVLNEGMNGRSTARFSYTVEEVY